MFVINKKRIQIMLSAIFVSVLVFGVQISLKEKGELTVETTSTPTSNKTIVVDAGHGTPDERNSLLTLKNNIDLLQKIKCFKHFIFFMLKRRLIYAKQRIW